MLRREFFKISSAENYTLRTNIYGSLRLSLYHLLYDITIILKKSFVYKIQAMHTGKIPNMLKHINNVFILAISFCEPLTIKHHNI